MSQHPRLPGTWPGRKSSTVIGIAAAIAIVAVVTGMLEARVALTAGVEPKNPLAGARVRFELQDSYFRPVSYLGLVTAGRKATLGFEIPGQIAALDLREGDPVEQGQMLARLDTDALQARRKATAAELAQARTELELARLKSGRQKELSATGAVSKEAFDDTRLRAQALASQVEAVEARLASIDIELEKSRLLAPYDGVIADRHVYQGAVVSAGTPVVRLVELTNQEARIGVPADMAGRLEIGSMYTLTLRDQSLQARLLTVRPDVDPVTRTTSAVFAIPAGVKALDGEPITLDYREQVRMRGGWLPMAALLEGQRGTWNVLRIEPDGELYRTSRESVEVLDVQGDRVYVFGTLPDGAWVVADGIHRITPGTLVRLAEAD
ncbi:MAG: efflux RND transporter periplasmic adaptor subunit [Halieaceae bacterium]|nr:efflux RND transporter periplasmic adaptor subunit [Halieaceae bacterium]